jgi:NAD-specific glutamate dehydrogenase
VPGGVQLALFEGLQSAARREALRLLAVRRGREPAELTARYAPAAASLLEDPLAIMPTRQRSELEQEVQRLHSVGVPRGLAERHVTRDLLARCMVMSDEALALGTPVRELARVRLARDEYLFLDEVRARAAAIQPADAYESRIVASAMVLVEKAATAVGERMLAYPAARGRSIDAWALECQPALSAAHPVIAEALALPGLSVARLAVIAECVRGLAEP